MKKKIYLVCFFANVVLIGYLTILIVLMALGYKFALDFFSNEINNIILSILLLPTFLLFIKNNMICFKKDRSEIGLLLLFLNIFYSPFYFIKVLRNNWLQGSRNATIVSVMYQTWRYSIIPLSSRIYNYYLLAQRCGLVGGICNPTSLYSQDL